MTTFKEFILEATKPKDLLAILEKDCKPYLAAIRADGGMFFRGIKGKPPVAIPATDGKWTEDIFKVTPRKDRQPLDTSREAHDAFDKYFKRLFKFKARSEGVFCVGDNHQGIDHIQMYGTMYMIFPIGEFSCVWSPKIQDLYKEYTEDFIAHTSQKPGSEYFEEDLEEWLYHMGYTTDVKGALHTKNEVMLKTKKYYAVSTNFYDDLIGKLK